MQKSDKYEGAWKITKKVNIDWRHQLSFDLPYKSSVVGHYLLDEAVKLSNSLIRVPFWYYYKRSFDEHEWVQSVDYMDIKDYESYVKHMVE